MEGPSGHRRIGVDIGGTFTDLVVFDDATGSFAVGKPSPRLAIHPRPSKRSCSNRLSGRGLI